MDSDEEQDDRSGRVLERLYLLETVIRTMDQLFSLFLSLRLSDQWPKECIRLDKWLRQAVDKS
jgi:recombination associated protein RdgC